jgi:DNA-directed RNA polymerase subunit H (RpoH/RPB5)
MSSSHNLVKHLYIARKNIIKYLKNLEYDVSEYEVFNISEIGAMEQNSSATVCLLDFEVTKEEQDGTLHTCHVMHHIRGNIKQNALEMKVTDYYDDKDDKSKHALIFVTLNSMNDTTQKAIRLMWKKYGEYVAMLDLPSLQFNILEHSLVPKHQKLTQEEAKEVFEKYNIKDQSQMPEISMFDPVAKAILLKPGEVCKIKRYNKISLENDFYRICVV